MNILNQESFIMTGKVTVKQKNVIERRRFKAQQAVNNHKEAIGELAIFSDPIPDWRTASGTPLPSRRCCTSPW